MMSRDHWQGAVRYGLPGLLVGLALAWWGGSTGSAARAMGAAPATETGGTIAITSPMNVSPNGMQSQLLYVIDTKAKAFAIYRFEPAGSKGTASLKFEAARQYHWDLQLSEYNNLPPEASAVERQIKSTPK